MMLILVLVNIVETVAVVELFGHFILNKPFLESISWYVSMAWDGICDMFRMIFRPGSFTEEALREMTGLWDMGLSGVKACMILQGIMCLVLFLTPLVAVGKAALADEDDGILPWLSGLYAPITWLISDFLLMGCFNLTDDIFETFQAIGLGGVALVIGVILGLMTTSAPVLILFIGSEGN